MKMGTDGELLLPHPVTPYHRNYEALKKMWIRNVATLDDDGEEEITAWKRFAILPCVPGQKYTIGRQFTSREEQGEFIYLGGCLSNKAKRERPICEITVERNRFWVNPICTSKTGVVLLNDVKIMGKTELKFGDYLSLGLTDVTFKTFLFKEREVDPAAFICSPTKRLPDKKAAKRGGRGGKRNMVPSPGQNGLIVSQILSYLPVAAVKKCRFVSKLWNEEASKVLKKRCKVEFGFNYVSKDFPDPMALFRYVVDMKNNPLSNLSITFVRTKAKMYRKFIEDMNWFLSGDNAELHVIKQLKLEGSYSTPPISDYRIYHKFLQTLGKHLEELTLGYHLNLDVDWANNHGLPELIPFPKLRVFTLSPGYAYAANTGGFQKLIKLIQGVTVIRLEDYGSVPLQFLKCLNESEYLKSFSNLSEISLLYTCPGPELIKILLRLQLPSRLKKLELNQLHSMTTSADFHSFGELLSKYARDLESLNFILPVIYQTDVVENPFFFNFPTFPKLEFLNIGWTPGRNHVKLLFPDGTSFINYGTQLPSLKSLTLWPTGFGKYTETEDNPRYPNQSNYMSPEQLWKDSAVFYETFFPAIVEGCGDEMEICKTLQRLITIYQRKQWGEKVLFSDAVGNVIASMFPNVNERWINTIRDNAGSSD